MSAAREIVFEVFPWNDTLDTGHAVIDAQHKELVTLLNRLASTLVGAEQAEVDGAFAALAAYADEHFAAEEGIWGATLGGVPWYEAHRHRHASFLTRVEEIRARHAGKPHAEIIERVVKFLIRWLAFHIIDDDKRVGFAIDAIAEGASIDDALAIANEKMGGSMRLVIDTVLNMYDDLSSRTLELLRERRGRIEAEAALRAANEELEKLVVTDQLTGIFNRRHLYATFDGELRRARRERLLLAYHLVDVDFFKRFNDHRGHVAGDEALRAVSGCLTAACRRPGDAAFRIGGEEFVVVSTHREVAGARAFGEQLRAGIEALRLPHPRSDAGDFVTASIGGVAKIPSATDRLEGFMAEADRSLYRAKEAGRNRVMMAD